MRKVWVVKEIPKEVGGEVVTEYRHAGMYGNEHGGINTGKEWNTCFTRKFRYSFILLK